MVFTVVLRRMSSIIYVCVFIYIGVSLSAKSTKFSQVISNVSCLFPFIMTKFMLVKHNDFEQKIKK